MTASSGSLAIAIVGMACRVPGAPDYSSFWANLLAGVCSLRRFDADALRAAGVSSAEAAHPSYVPVHGYLAGYDRFDAAWFGYTPLEADLMDPQQRILLECAAEALQDAAYDAPVSRAGRLTGVYVGLTISTYLANNVLPRRDILSLVGEQQVMLGCDKDYAALRIAYKLDLNGPALVVQGACASALVALHVAGRSLLSGECDLALAGGSSVRAPQVAGYLYTPGGTASPDGACHAFDARASGSVAGSGCGIVVLKRLEDALADQDHIHAVIRGTAVTNDGGGKSSFVLPTAEGQARAIRHALAFANVDPDDVRLVEAHGTGTAVGDPIEVSALDRGYPKGESSGDLLLGTVKANIGHLDAAASIVGLIRMVQSLKTGLAPPVVGFGQANPTCGFEATRMRLVTQAKQVAEAGSPILGAVNAIGMGGINAHAILESPPRRSTEWRGLRTTLLPLSANTPESLDSLVERTERFIESDIRLDAAAYSLQTGRRSAAVRLAVVGSNRATLCNALRRRGPPVAVGPRGVPVRLVFLFPGQGVMQPAAIAAAARLLPPFAQKLDGVLLTVARVLGRRVDLDAAVSPGDHYAASLLAQIATFAASLAMTELLGELGLRPAVVAGHSLGEISAAVVAGVFTVDAACQLIDARARAFAQTPRGAMLAITSEALELEPLPVELSIAVRGGANQVTVAGPREIVDNYAIALRRRGFAAVRLPADYAYHTAAMMAAAEAVMTDCAVIAAKSPDLRMISGVTGEEAGAELGGPRYWRDHVVSPVRFDRVADTLCAMEPSVVIDVGPGHVLADQLRAHPGMRRHRVVQAGAGRPRAEDAEHALLTALAATWEAGGDIRWDALWQSGRPDRIPCPPYPFAGRRFWLDPRAPSATSSAPEPMQRPREDAADMANRLQATVTIFPDRIVIKTGGADPIETSPPGEAQSSAAVCDQEPPNVNVVRHEPAPRLSCSVAGIAAALLGVPSVEPEANLIELGANSLTLVQLAFKVSEQLGVRLSIDDVLADPTVAALERLLAASLRLDETVTAPTTTVKASAGAAELEPISLDSILDEVERMTPHEVALALGEAK